MRGRLSARRQWCKLASMTANVLIHPTFAATTPAPTESVQPDRDEAFLDFAFARFRNVSLAKGHQPKYTAQLLNTFRSFLACIGKPLVDVKESDYEAWSADLADVRRLAMSTRRTYQKAIRLVIQYFHDTADIQAEAMRVLGGRLTKFAHADNSILHVVEDETAGRLRPMDDDELAVFLGGFKTRIDRAEAEAPRELRALYRDKAMFFVMYATGVRLAELCALDLEDWRKDPAIPELGRYAQLSVRLGKGAKGSGPRHRLVPTSDVRLAQVMAWYERDVRPDFDPKPGHEKALFLSERGLRISRASVQNRFGLHLEQVGLHGLGFSPHSMRRTSVKDDTIRVGAEFARAKAGHASTRTTMIYGQVPFDHHRRQAQRMVREQITTMSESDET